MSQSEEINPAEVYERHLGPTIADPWTRVLLEYAALKSGDRVLDLACGTGSVARQVAPIVGGEGRVVAYDINSAMLDVGRALPAPKGATIEWQEGDATGLTLPDGVFDLVLCQQGLQFFTDRTAALREARRVLTNGGRIVISVWRALRCHPLYEALFEATARHLEVDMSAVALPFSLGNADELHALLSEAGFHRINVTPQSLEVHLPSPDRFVQLTVLGAATSVPAFAQLNTEVRCSLVETVTREADVVVRRYRDGDALVYPMFTHFAVAYA